MCRTGAVFAGARGTARSGAPRHTTPALTLLAKSITGAHNAACTERTLGGADDAAVEVFTAAPSVYRRSGFSAACPRGGETLLLCSGHGTCDSFSATCLCDRFYGGPSCSNRCPSGIDNIVCSGHGSCSEGTQGSGLCQCHRGYSGVSCSATCLVDYGLACRTWSV